MDDSVLANRGQSSPKTAAVPTEVLDYTIPSSPAMLSTPAERGSNKERLLFERFAKTRDPALRDRLVRDHEPLARYLASKFAGRGEPIEDLVQIANLGLVKCIDRFDVSRNIKFGTFATSTIVGEIQRYFRDSSWRMKVPRALKELNWAAAKAKESLTASLGRPPTVAQVAQAIGATETTTLEAIELGNAYTPASLDSSVTEAGRELTEFVGAEDTRIESIVNNDDLNSAIASLGAREQAVIADYFYNEMTETEIAQKLCVSQMHVSRLKKKALASMKLHMADARSEPTRTTMAR